MAAAAFIAGCTDAVEPYDAIYMTDAQVNPDKSLTVDELPSTIRFTVSSSVVATEDVTVSLEVRPDLLEGFNAKYEKNYLMAPEGSFNIPSLETEIRKGFNVSSPLELEVTSKDEFQEGTTYCVPVSIKSTSGMTVLEPSRTLFIVLKTPVISKAIYLGSGNIYEIHSFKDNPDLAALSRMTLETRVYMNSFHTVDPYISSIMGIEGECGVRFGDVKVDPDCIQICHGDYQPAATATPLSTGKWYHVAAVWTGSSWDIYIDGQYITGQATAGETINLARIDDRAFYLGASYGRGRTLDGYIAETRVWTRALSQSEIANNMNYVDPESPGLLAYWRMNAWEQNTDSEHSGNNVVRDLTGNGHDAYGDASSPQMIDTKWL